VIEHGNCPEEGRGARREKKWLFAQSMMALSFFLSFCKRSQFNRQGRPEITLASKEETFPGLHYHEGAQKEKQRLCNATLLLLEWEPLLSMPYVIKFEVYNGMFSLA
jgi:hypothetical protein